MKLKAPIAFLITQKWKGQSKDLKYRVEKLTDTDLAFEPGMDDDVLTRIGQRLAKTRPEVIDALKEKPKNI